MNHILFYTLETELNGLPYRLALPAGIPWSQAVDAVKSLAATVESIALDAAKKAAEEVAQNALSAVEEAGSEVVEKVESAIEEKLHPESHAAQGS